MQDMQECVATITGGQWAVVHACVLHTVLVSVVAGQECVATIIGVFRHGCTPTPTPHPPPLTHCRAGVPLRCGVHQHHHGLEQRRGGGRRRRACGELGILWHLLGWCGWRLAAGVPCRSVSKPAFRGQSVRGCGAVQQLHLLLAR